MIVIRNAGSALVSAIAIAASLTLLFLAAPPANAANASVDSQINAAPVVRPVPNNPPSLDKPNMDEASLLAWAEASASDILTFDYLDYEQHLKFAPRYFTKAGWKTFETFAQSWHFEDDLSLRQKAFSTKPLSPTPTQSGPTVIESGLRSGKYHWQVRMPLIMVQSHTRSGRRSRTPAKFSILLDIERVDASSQPDGIAISRWTEPPLSPKSSTTQLPPQH